MTRTSNEIKQEIEAKFGFIPPFFEPAFATPSILENLWQQTLTGYIENPLPDLFKEKLAALISRYCSVPYCLICHSSTLRPLGMNSQDVFDLLQQPALSYRELAEKTECMPESKLKLWPESGSHLEECILYCCVAVYLNTDSEKCLEKLRQMLTDSDYNYLVLFIAYNKTALTWAESHPELSYQADKRYKENFSSLINEEPGLKNFFDNYSVLMQKQEDSRLKWLTNENKEFAQKERELRKNLESALEETKAEKNNLHDFFMQAPVPMVILDGKDLLFTLANPLYEKLVGRQVVGKTLVQAFEPGEVDLYIPILNKVLETGVPYIGKEMPLALPDDHNVIQHKWIDLGYHPLKSQDGKIKGLMAIVQDVTAQVEARKIIEARESHFRQISDGLSLMIWISGPEGVIYWANTWWYNYTGFKHLDLTGKDSPVHPDDIPEGHKRWLHSMSSGEDFNIEMRFKRKSDNTYRWHLVKAVAVRTANGNIEKWVGSSVDIEHQKFLVSELEQEKDLREKFVAALTHDLRTPLTGAKMSAQILDRKVSDDMRSLTSKIISSVDRADHMVQDLLDAGKIKAGEKFLLNLKLCDLNDIVNNTIEDLSTVHGSRFKIESNQHIEGMWDGDVIRRILENLANNAVKYGSMESPIEIKLKSDGKDASIAVHNKGNPISPDEQSKLFEAYRRSESATTSNQKGWGIGLTLVQGFSKALGGDVRVTSSINEGTTFTVSLPQKQNT